MRDFIRQCGDAAGSALPPSWTRWPLARAAIAPPIRKTPLFERVCASLVRSSLGAKEDVVVTNFGLGKDLRCHIALSDSELVPAVDGAFEYVAPVWNWLFCRLSPSELAARLSATGFRVRNGG